MLKTLKRKAARLVLALLLLLLLLGGPTAVPVNAGDCAPASGSSCPL